MPKSQKSSNSPKSPKNLPSDFKIALVCDWLTEIGGAEQVLKTLHEMFPDAPIYTSQYRHKVDTYFASPQNPPKPSKSSPKSPKNTPSDPRKPRQGSAPEKPLDVRTGWLNRLPAASRRFIAPLRQHYFSRLDLTAYDLVISVTGCDAKFVKARPGRHLCYCHVPTQYYWGKYEDYLKNPGFGALNPLARLALKTLVPVLRKNDLKAAARPDFYVTISTYAAREIKKYYKREARVIAPPVNVELFQQPVENSHANREIKRKKSQEPVFGKSAQKNATKSTKCQTTNPEQISCSVSTPVENSEKLVRFLKNNRGRYYINFSRQVNWKNLDLIVEACETAKIPLLLIGDGPEHENLQKLAEKIRRTSSDASAPNNSPQNLEKLASESVFFLPSLPQNELKTYLSGAKAFLFPSEEPFGIAPVEALAAGCPVVALRRGGALDYVQDGKNGLFFASKKPPSVIRALKRFEKSPVARRRKPTIAKTALPFSERVFREKMLQYIYEILEDAKNH